MIPAAAARCLQAAIGPVACGNRGVHQSVDAFYCGILSLCLERKGVLRMQELIYKNAVLRNGDLRKRVCNRAILEFCSLLGMNLADMRMEGVFWEMDGSAAICSVWR